MSESEERRALNRVEYFSHSIELVHRNYAILIDGIDDTNYQRRNKPVSRFSNDWQRHDMLKEVSFRLHDYVAAVKSLVDHSRRLYDKWYEPVGRLSGYPARRDATFVDDGLVRTVHGLREMALHQELPNVTLVRTWGERDLLKARVVVKTNDLLRYEGWKSAARLLCGRRALKST